MCVRSTFCLTLSPSLSLTLTHKYTHWLLSNISVCLQHSDPSQHFNNNTRNHYPHDTRASGNQRTCIVKGLKLSFFLSFRTTSYPLKILFVFFIFLDYKLNYVPEHKQRCNEPACMNGAWFETISYLVFLSINS